MNHCTSGFSKSTCAILAALLLVASGASAHIKNEATQFPDIEFSDARFDIVVLVGAGIIPETPVFEPDKALTKRELATWVALAEGLGRGGENPDTQALADAAIEQGAIDSLDGEATFADVNTVFFGGQLTLDDGAVVPTKAEAASLIAAQLGSESGAALLEKRGLAIGPSGRIAEVAVREGHHGTAYVMTVGDRPLPMDEHGRVANGPTDLLQWEGRDVRRSFVHGSDDHASWIYLEARPLEPEPVSTMPVGLEPPPVEELPPPDRSLLYWLAGAALVLGLVLFISRRQSG
jgi:hypothetical protein